MSEDDEPVPEAPLVSEAEPEDPLIPPAPDEPLMSEDDEPVPEEPVVPEADEPVPEAPLASEALEPVPEALGELAPDELVVSADEALAFGSVLCLSLLFWAKAAGEATSNPVSPSAAIVPHP